MTPNAFKRIALALPEAHEQPHFERTSFRVGKRIFATLAPGGEEAMVKLASTDGIEALLAMYPDVFFSHGTWTTRNGALGVRLAKADPVLMKKLITDAWRGIAPKRASRPKPTKKRRAKRR